MMVKLLTPPPLRHVNTDFLCCKIQEIYTDMGYFKNKNYCIDKSVLKT